MASKQDNIDTSSIIENKILTKTYWEQKILDEQKLNSKHGKLLIPNRGDKVIKLLSDGESEPSLESTSLTPVDSLIDTKLVQPDNCVRGCKRIGLFTAVDKSIELEKLDQQNSDTEEELYSDCLEQFVDDQIDRCIEQSKLSYHLNDTLNDKKSSDDKQKDNMKCSEDDLNQCSNDKNSPLESSTNQAADDVVSMNQSSNELLSVIEEEDSLEQRSINLEQVNTTKCVHQNDETTKLEEQLSLKDAEKLRVKVGGRTDQQVDYVENSLEHSSNKQPNEKANNESNIDVSNTEQQPTNWAVHKRTTEQVIERTNATAANETNFVKPKQQGDRVSVTQCCAKQADNDQVNNDQCAFSEPLKESSSHEKSLEHFHSHTTQPPSACSTANHLLLAKSKSRSESPSIHFQQRVSVVKNTFENRAKLAMMMNSVENIKSSSDKLMNSSKCDKIDKNANTKCDKVLATKGLKKVEDDRLIETESKIAREIRELREREEELRQMRLERLNKENLINNCTISCLTNNCNNVNCPKNYLSSSNSTTSSSADSTISLNRSDKSSERSDSPPVTNDQCSTSIDSLDEGFAEYNKSSPNSAASNGNKQSTDILLSPKANVLNSSTNSSGGNPAVIQKILATTRIQQEIEEQTKRELALRAVGSIKTISQERTDKLSISNLCNLGNNTANVLSPTLSLSSLASSLSSLNIPTSNNSQSNSINQTSDLASSAASTPIANGNVGALSKLNAATSFPKSNNQPQPQQQQQITCLSTAKTKVKTNLYTKNTNHTSSTGNGLLRYRTFSTSHLNSLSSNGYSASCTSSNNNNTNPTVGNNIFKLNQTGRHISMHKFIQSKGKSAIVDYSSSSSSSNQFGSAHNMAHSDLSYSYTDLLLPPKIDPIKAHKIIEKKCLQSADYKISSELRDLYQREEELRKQRARLHGQSQPNLSLIDCEDQTDSTNDQQKTNATKANADNKQKLITDREDGDQVLPNFSLQGCRARPLANLLKKATSNPNLTEAQVALQQSQSDHQQNEQSIGKSASKEVQLETRNLCSSSKLIAQWENEISKTEKIK